MLSSCSLQIIPPSLGSPLVGMRLLTSQRLTTCWPCVQRYYWELHVVRTVVMVADFNPSLCWGLTVKNQQEKKSKQNLLGLIPYVFQANRTTRLHYVWANCVCHCWHMNTSTYTEDIIWVGGPSSILTVLKECGHMSPGPPLTMVSMDLMQPRCDRICT